MAGISPYRPIGLFTLTRAILTFVLITQIVPVVDALGSTDTITSGGDNSRAGYQTNHNMDPAVVGSDQFGILWKRSLPGNYRGATEQVFAQPLVYTPGDTQYVYLATTMNNLYKIDAKQGTIVERRNLAVPFLEADLDGCSDINPLIGSTATGVIDPDTNTWYFTIKTYVDQNDVVKGRLNGRYFIYAVDVDTLADKPNYPIPLEGLIARNNDRRMFISGNQHQRPALLQVGNYIYAGFASHCVMYNYTGYIIGWEKSTGNIVEAFTTEAGPEPNTVRGGGIWMSGGGLTSDDAGSMWFSTGNGYASQLHGTPVPGRQPPSALEEAAVHMKINDDGTLKVIDFFMPWEKEQLDGADKDLGTTPLELLPSAFSCPGSKRLGVVTGKSGKTYFLDMDNLGGYSMGAGGGSDAVPQVFQNENSVYSGAGVYPLEGGYVYINIVQHPTRAFKFSCDSGGNAVFTPVALSKENSAFILGGGHGTTTSKSGEPGTGLLWLTDVQGFGLRVYKAVPEGGVLVGVKFLNIAGVTKFTRPVFGNGIVYIATTTGFLYAAGSPVNPPLICSSPYDFGRVVIGNSSAPKNISCQANTTTTITGVGLSSSANFILSEVPSLPFALSAGRNFTFQAVFKPSGPGQLSNDVLLNTTNGAAGFSTQTAVSLVGVGDSLDPLLAVQPNTVTFTGVITGQTKGGVTEPFIILNRGDSVLNISGYDFSVVREGGPLTTPNNTSKGPNVGPFTFEGLPTSVPANGQVTVNVNFDPSTSGKFAVYLTIRSNGGNAVVDIVGTSGTYPKALLEFQSADGESWIPYRNDTAFTFGDVVEQQTVFRKLRLTNAGGPDASPLSITVSKIPIGTGSIIGAENTVDLAEGTSILPGQYAEATLYCSVPRSQVNIDSYNGAAVWTMNTGDPTFGKQAIQFYCQAVAEQVGPLRSDGTALYRYVGCAKENNPGRQLQTQLWGRNNNTNGMCQDACYAAGWTFAGTEYEKENQTCGGNGVFHDGSYISLFANANKFTNTSGSSASTSTTSSVPTGSPVVNPGNSLFKSLGCWTEPSGARALPNLVLARDDLTVSSCLAACSNFIYIGVEYSRECWCGDGLDSGSKQAAPADCNMPCSGNSSELCGGSLRLNLYVSVSATSGGSVTSTTASPSTTQASPTAVQTTGNYVLLGCYSEASNQRALTGKAIFDDLMTVELCRDGCSGYNFFGVEYGRECYCGGAINNGSVLAPSQSDCNFPCPGNNSELCGAGNRLDMYKLKTVSRVKARTSIGNVTPAGANITTIGTSDAVRANTSNALDSVSVGSWQYIGCFTDQIPRGLSQEFESTYQMTAQECQSFCLNRNFPLSGVEFGRECFCGTALQGNSTLAPDSDCNMPCSGNASDTCGGSFRMNVWQYEGWSPTKIVDSVGSYKLQGCWTDDRGARALSGFVFTDSASMTPGLCVFTCKKRGFIYAGVEYGRECYCGASLAGSSTERLKEECNMLCSGNREEFCGAGDRLLVYKDEKQA
ncbi:hypothetical protein GP486_003989 [Trichoglossum hirsutum]|uniref:WSC domain-containing protein n=1 Tax=Trichoglossum hirsutum TaxID=265104 RepID=A0A9P8RPW0_9PEZI|nr:hypothetical protein GP486_003989 [Trichoglossum hirsutum]